jgi:hypothetical protein
MRSSKLLAAVAAGVALGCVALYSATPAFAFIACSASRDCWQTGSKVKWPGTTLMYHEDSWRDEHKDDQRYHWHEADPQHDWHNGFWADGAWHTG